MPTGIRKNLVYDVKFKDTITKTTPMQNLVSFVKRCSEEGESSLPCILSPDSQCYSFAFAFSLLLPNVPRQSPLSGL